tara:strand:- start:486 stop:896 length:411 start_codon:yes stop_codon:yes gene_type:complete
MNSINNVELISLRAINDNRGSLLPIDFKDYFKSNISRLFIVNGAKDSIRGFHAHKELTQYLICLSGSCVVICKDGSSQIKFLLNKQSEILKIPKHIWAEQHYKTSNTSLMVLCDSAFDENDYIRDYNEYKEFMNNK